MLIRLARVMAMLAILLTPAAAAAQQALPPQAPLPDKPFAEHHLVIQLSDAAQAKQALTLSVAYNMLKI